MIFPSTELTILFKGARKPAHTGHFQISHHHEDGEDVENQQGRCESDLCYVEEYRKIIMHDS